MGINSIAQTGYSAYASSTTITKDEDSITIKTASISVGASQTSINQDTYVPSEQTGEASDVLTTYSPPKKLTSEQVEALERQVYDSMKSMVEKMLGIQIGKSEESSIDVDAMSVEELADALGVGTTPETAAAAISADGLWGVDAVATRLMDMAMYLSNGDSEMAEELRAAVQDGFEAVGVLDSLPQVCQDTYAETMDRFDYWAEHGSLEGYGEETEDAGAFGHERGAVFGSEAISIVVSETTIEW